MFIELYSVLIKYFSDSNEYIILRSLTCAPFSITIYVLREILEVTKGLYRLLQSSQIDLVKAASEIDNVYNLLSSWRSSDEDVINNKVFDKAEEVYAEVND